MMKPQSVATAARAASCIKFHPSVKRKLLGILFVELIRCMTWWQVNWIILSFPTYSSKVLNYLSLIPQINKKFLGDGAKYRVLSINLHLKNAKLLQILSTSLNLIFYYNILKSVCGDYSLIRSVLYNNRKKITKKTAV